VGEKLAEDYLALRCLPGHTGDIAETSEEDVTHSEACEWLAGAARVIISSLYLKDRGFRKPSLRVARLNAQDLVEINQRRVELMRVLFDGRP